MSNATQTKTEVEICREAITVQDAPNLAGVLLSFRENNLILRDLLGDWDKANRHPAMVLFTAQIMSLTGSGIMDTQKYATALTYCRYCQHKS